MTVIGITGPSGAGKTTVLGVLEELDAAVIDCDELYHKLLREDTALREGIRARFGPSVFDGDGNLNRKALGNVVFHDPDALAELNRLTHAAILAALEGLLDKARAEGRPAAAIDAIALIESGAAARCDVTVAVTASAQTRVKRLMAREGVSEEYARARIDAQRPDQFYEENCDHVLHNDGTPEDCRRQARDLFERILHPKEDIKIMEEKTPGQLRREALFSQKKNGWDLVSKETEQAIFAYGEDYKAFLNAARTERLTVKAAVALAEEKGFRPFERGMELHAGDKVYRVNRDKALSLAVVGSAPLDQGAVIAAAHIDSPRLDLKPAPLFEDGELAYFKTHYYGGIRKYQWLAIPLELHGVVALKNGEMVDVEVGSGPDDPKFTVSDLLPHLAAEQNKKTLSEAVSGEKLNLLIGSRPFAGDSGSDRVKLAVLDLLNQKYGITEDDFYSAELEAVPSFPACDIGLDRTMVGAYGHDDRVCGYAALRALLDLENTPRRTAVCVLVDKEEIGSEGVSGMQSAAFDTFMSDLCDTQRVPLKACYERSLCLSADVAAAFDPNFADVYEKRNAALLNYGVGLCKYTGSRGKSGASDASAELMGYVRHILDDKNISWQVAELGKVDVGGGGTVAKFMAERDIDTLDAGVPVLSMHAPFETVSKLDCYMTYAAVKAVYEA